ncbi:hydrogenase [Pelagerythrobacter rhizovicinus]|uniref:Hydrogenase n=1 Tax=Pelagerythrobacter rhizovicinus TaxID=2268576 RepID=A0A4Q2KN49_9SPHN|nr:hydrogenase [Pelagerythrobacter rhizovicinus]RXZ64601.1 hydrogenase [Pelagerythrobacter rhizovicinus]
MSAASASFQKSLVVAGAILFLLGLLQGAAVQSFANPRMALSAHLTAVQSGLALMIVGVIWPAVGLNATLLKVACWAVILGMYGLWLGLTLSAATGASDALPIAGAGYKADWLSEASVSAIVLVSSGLMTLGWLLFVVGLIRRRSDGVTTERF